MPGFLPLLSGNLIITALSLVIFGLGWFVVFWVFFHSKHFILLPFLKAFLSEELPAEATSALKHNSS